MPPPLSVVPTSIAELTARLKGVHADLLEAVSLLSGVTSGRAQLSAVLVAQEMKTLYTLLAIVIALSVKPVRSAAYKTVDTLVALVLLVAISAVILGIPFVISYLSFKAVMFVGGSALAFMQDVVG